MNDEQWSVFLPVPVAFCRCKALIFGPNTRLYSFNEYLVRERIREKTAPMSANRTTKVRKHEKNEEKS